MMKPAVEMEMSIFVNPDLECTSMMHLHFLCCHITIAHSSLCLHRGLVGGAANESRLWPGQCRQTVHWPSAGQALA